MEPGTEIEERDHHSTREEEIRRRAYEIYLERGAQSGLELDDWLQAERELTAEWPRAQRLRDRADAAVMHIGKRAREQFRIPRV
jgi:hypothetical protein